MSLSKRENIRRQRLGNLRTLYRARCGHTLPDDDAGREYLRELLLTISQGHGSERKMQHVISIAAPWMNQQEANEMTDQIKRLKDYLRYSPPREIGNRLRVTREEWIRLKLKTILPFDMTDEEIAEFRKANKRARDQRRRLKAGAKSREAYLANALTKSKPWEAEGVSRRTWFRNRVRGRGTSPRRIKLSYRERLLVPTECVGRPEGADHGRGERKEKIRKKKKSNSLNRLRGDDADQCHLRGDNYLSQRPEPEPGPRPVPEGYVWPEDVLAIWRAHSAALDEILISDGSMTAKRPWSTPTLTEITDPAEIAAWRRIAAAEDAEIEEDHPRQLVASSPHE